MNQRKQQKSCSHTNKEFNSVVSKREGDKRIFEIAHKDGGLLKLIMKTPLSKLGKTMKKIFYSKAAR